MPIIAVITIDLVKSSDLSSEELEKTMLSMVDIIELFKEQTKISYYEVFRGDSIQFIVPEAEQALKVAYAIRAAVKAIKLNGDTKQGNKVQRDVRLGIGIGMVKDADLNRMTNEEPFVRSGKELDRITEAGIGVGVSSGILQIDRELETELYLYEGMVKNWTLASAEVIHHKLLDKTEHTIANDIGISQSAVNQHSHAAFWNGLKALLKRYEELTGDYYNE